MTTDSKDNGGIVGGLFSFASKAGRAWREQVQPGLAAAKERMDAISGMPAQARSYFSSMTPEGQEVRSRWNALQARLNDGLSSAVTGLRGIAAVSMEALQGMDQRLALRLLELHALETIATTRAALTHPALVGAKEKFENLREELKADPEADVTSQLEELSATIAAATKAVKSVPMTEGDLRRQFVTMLGTLGEFDSLTADYTEQSEVFADRFGQGTLSDQIDPALLSGLQPRIQSLRQQLLDKPLESAVEVSVLSDEVDVLKQRYVDALDFMARQTQRLRSLEGLMNTMVTRAEDGKVNNDTILLAKARGFIKATRQKPINLAEAESCKDEYIDRLEALDA